MEPAEIVRELSRPEAYPFEVERIDLLRTHVSLLFFAGERVYKVKKPVDYGFLDFTTLELRRHFCEEEVRLNRRLAPDVYLGVARIVRGRDGRLHVIEAEAPGEDTPRGEELVETAVEMRRLPAHRMLDALLGQGEIDNAMMNELADRLAAFHAAAATGEGVDEHGAPEAVAANALENFEQLAPFAWGTWGSPGSADPSGRDTAALQVLDPAQLGFLERRTRAFLDTHVGLLAERVRDGRIREGHGDLHSGNICYLDEGVVAYDCIEFNRRFRCGDVAADLAFLAMDLDYRGFPAFSSFLVKLYVAATGDTRLPEVLGFYKGYRAVVRGKVACLTASDRDLDEAAREERVADALRHLQLAASYELPPALVLLCGLPATGKSWLARRLARPLRGVVLHSDVRRKVLAGMAPSKRVRERYDAGMYAPEAKARTYRSLLADALRTLRAGHTVVVDATFSKREFRAPFVDRAARLELPYYVVHVTAPEEVVRERLERRALDTGEPSDADLEVYLRARESFEPPDEVPDRHVLEVVSGEGLPEQRSALLIDRMIELAAR